MTAPATTSLAGIVKEFGLVDFPFAVADLQTKGMAYNELSPAEQRRISATVKPVTDKLAAGYDADTVKLYQSELARITR